MVMAIEGYQTIVLMVIAIDIIIRLDNDIEILVLMNGYGTRHNSLTLDNDTELDWIVM